jgi:hypothetical protein
VKVQKAKKSPWWAMKLRCEAKYSPEPSHFSCWKNDFIICKSGFLDFVHRLYFNKITFRKLDLLPFYLKTEEDPASETL